jgi:hypothetical protein
VDRQLNQANPYSQKILDRINKWFALPQARELKRELSAVREENQALRLEVQAVGSGLESANNQEEKRLAEVRLRMEQIESDRDTTHHQLQQVHVSLSDAANRQDALDERMDILAGKQEEQHMTHKADIKKAQDQVHGQADQVVQLESSLSQTVNRQDHVDSRLQVLVRKLDEQHMDHKVEIHEAALRDQKQRRRLNFAMTVAGCAFLVTTGASVAWIKDSRKNAEVLSDVSRNIRDIKLTMDRQVSGLTHEPLEVASAVMVDEALPAEELSQPVMPIPGHAGHTGEARLAGQEVLVVSDDNATTSEVDSLPQELQHKSSALNEMPTKEEPLVVPVKVSPAAISARETEVMATPKAAPDRALAQEELSGAGELPETVDPTLPYEVLADRGGAAGMFPINSKAGNSLSASLNPVRPGLGKDKVVAEFTLGQDDTSTSVKSSYDAGKLYGVGVPFTRKNQDEAKNSLSASLNSIRPGLKQDKAIAELSHGQNDKSTFVKSSYNVGKLFGVGASFTQKNRDDEFQPLTDKKKGFWRMKMNSSLLGSSLDAEMALSSFDTETSKNFWAPERRMMKLGSQTTWLGFDIGARYQSVGKDFESSADMFKSGHKKKKDKFDKDTQGPELWSSRQFGNLGVKAYTSLYSTNLADDPNLPRFSTQKVGSSVNYLISSWPEVGVTLRYATGTLDSSDEPAGFDSVSQDVRDIASSIYYSGDSWSGSLYVGDATGKTSEANVTDMQTYYAEASYLPIDTVSISPAISYIRTKYPNYDVDSNTMSSSLTVAYKPRPNGLSYTLYSEYSTDENRDWDVDSSYLYTSLGVKWEPKKPKSLIKQWSVDLFYDEYIDNIYNDSNTGGLGIMFKLRSSPRSARRFSDDLHQGSFGIR